MKKSVVGVIALSVLLTGVSAFDLGDVTKGLGKTLEAGKKVGVVKSPDDIVKDNINDKKNVEACKQYYHKNKIALYGNNDIPSPTTARNEARAHIVLPKELDDTIESYKKAVKKLEKQDFDISKHSKKNLDNHALCKFIFSESKTFRANDGIDKFKKETAKYDKK
ncbi:hypothetical protein T36_0449 [Helicobacter cinaedi]|uniref:hypothetical protein n=1 Tax=Helicobacter cinaedi TaxID=213 RepID=UPI001F250289|nr:hypothetical protein [Helicobacter cinaedi]BDB64002.1 hypothetical protein T36_0449 [Helicobacter cinaedi]